MLTDESRRVAAGEGGPGRRVLIFAYYFPPVGGIGSIRLAGFASHLPEFGWEPTIVAPVGTPHPADESIGFPESKVVRAKSLEPALLLRRRGGTSVRTDTSTGPGAPNNGGAQAQRGAGATTPDRRRSAARTTLVRLAFPDAQIGWYPAAVAAGLRLVREQSFDAVFSSAYPMTAHLIAWSVSHRAGLPWIAEYRDPWSERLPRFPHRPAAERLERSIAHRASRIVVPSRAFAGHYAVRWGVDVDAIPNGHDLLSSHDADTPTTIAPAAPPILAHVGSYYPGRQSLRTVWRALAELRAAGREMPKIRWVGELAAEARDEALSYGVLDAIEVTGLVSHSEAIGLLQSSTMLFASGELDTGPLGRGTTAAKLFEYLASGLPILYVCSRDADAAVTLKRYEGCHVVEFDDDSAARRALEAGLAGGRFNREVGAFSRRARTADLAKVLSSVTA